MKPFFESYYQFREFSPLLIASKESGEGLANADVTKNMNFNSSTFSQPEHSARKTYDIQVSMSNGNHFSLTRVNLMTLMVSLMSSSTSTAYFFAPYS